MKFYSFIVSLFILNFTSGVFANPIQIYRLGQYSADAARCQEDAEKLGAKFQNITGLPLLDASCQQVFGQKFDLIIQYQADAAIAPVSTFVEFGGHQGFYTTSQECEANLLHEIPSFEQQTGLPVFVAFCFAQSPPNRENPHPFTARIDAFGSPKNRPFTLLKIVYDLPATAPIEITKTIQSALSANKNLIQPLVISDITEGYLRIYIRYFAVRRQPLIVDSLVSFESVTACNSSIQNIQNLFAEFGLGGAKLFCTKENLHSLISPAYLVGSVSGVYDLQRVPRTFQSRALCETSLADLVSRYAKIYDSSHVKGYCSYERLDLLSDHKFFAKVLIQQ